jgi:chemotaxis protein MotB
VAKAGDNARPILKRKKIVQGGEHHGGAWKVAYADFVTAMMAFFLLMWLLNATTEKQRKGIADFFNPSIPISRISAGGDGLFSGTVREADTKVTENGIGARENLQNDSEVKTEAVAADTSATDQDAAFAAVQNLLRGDSGESEVEDELLNHVSVRITDEGLIIELIDHAGPPLFAPGSAEPSPKLAALLQIVAEVAGLLSNPVAIDDHTDALPFADPAYSNWDLSTDRAQAARRLLEAGGVPTGRFRRVTGKGASEPVADPFAPENRRITVTFLRTIPDARR